MEVQCERCKTSYDFDDALVSARGTTVKCTSCGHQFKVRRDGSEAVDRWLVKTVEGREHVFASIGELRRAIVSRQIGRADTLVRGREPPRALGAIVGLEPFFEEVPREKGSGARTMPEGPRARLGSQPGGASRPPPPKVTSGSTPGARMTSNRPPAPLGGRSAPSLRPAPTPTPPPTGFMPGEPMRPRIDTIRPPGAVPPPRPSAQPHGYSEDDVTLSPLQSAPVSVAPVLSLGEPIPPSYEEEPETVERMQAPTPPPAPFGLASSPPPPRVASHAPRTLANAPHGGPPPAPKTLIGSPSFPNDAPMRAPLASTPLASGMSDRPPPPTIQPLEAVSMPPPTKPVKLDDDAMRAAFSSVDDGLDIVPPRPRRIGGWLVALVLLAGASVIGFAVAKPYLAARAAAPSAPALDPRAAQYVADGERAMASGDLEAANDDFAKASALAEKDPRILVDVARLAASRADVPWLGLKLLPADATDDAKSTSAQLDDLAGRARSAAGAALAAAPEDKAAILADIDSRRLRGDSAGARALVPKVIANASEPDVAYVLAALDLGEAEPLWPMILDRLHVAASAEGSAGRARAALVYALARSGDGAGARAEFDKLAAVPRVYPLLGQLRAFVGRTTDAAKKLDAGTPKAPSGMAPATIDVSALPRASRAPARGGGGEGESAGGGGGGGRSNDPRVLLQQAEAAKQTHDYERANALYSALLAQNPSDSEALAGLGDVAKGQHDIAGAAGYYKRALAANPVYLPALVGLGDCEWDSGDKDEAQKTYRDITERFPEGTYPGRVTTRANGTTSSPPQPANAPGDPSGASP